MILINNEWYNPKDLDDVSTIIREQFSYDLADRMDELVIDFDSEIEERRSEISDLKDEINSNEYEISKMRTRIR